MRSSLAITEDHRSQCLWASDAYIHRALLVLAMIITFCAAGCAKHVSVARRVSIGHTEIGIASWYGDPYHGRKTASGEVYDMNRPTAAHRSMPFGTWVEVTNLNNAKRVSVRITDRGPFVEGRIIDLSRAAAQQIEMIGPGTARVRVKVVRAPVVKNESAKPHRRDLAP